MFTDECSKREWTPDKQTLGILVTWTSKPITFARYLSWSRGRTWHVANGNEEVTWRPLVLPTAALAEPVIATNNRNSSKFQNFLLKIPGQ